MSNEIVKKMRAIEALRSGVPSRAAVEALGCSQPIIEKAFKEKLESIKSDFPNGRQTQGMLLSGDFGSGKSHLLEHLHHLALENNFVSSRIVISKETPLHDPVKLYRNAIETAVVPGKRGDALTEIATALNPQKLSYDDFYHWLTSPDSGLCDQFAATLCIYVGLRNAEQETANRIIRFWSGDKLGISDIRKALRALEKKDAFKLERAKERDLALQKFKFTPRLIYTAGYSGWVLLIDEVELIGRYSLRQRAKSYAELSRLMGNLEDTTYAGLICVMAITEDFTTQILDQGGKHDLEKVPNRLENDLLLSSQAQSGMQLIENNRITLKAPDDKVLAEVYGKVKTLHKEAYNWEPPDVSSAERLTTTRLRTYIKRWINEWDLKRLDPEFKPELAIDEIGPGYIENPDLETTEENNYVN